MLMPMSKMNKLYIMNLLNEIILQLEEIMQEENSFNEGSLTYDEFQKLLNKFKLIYKELMKDE